MVCGNFILPEPASYVFFYALSNLRNLLYIIIAREALPCRNEVTQNSPDIQVSGLFASQSALTGLAPV